MLTNTVSVLAITSFVGLSLLQLIVPVGAIPSAILIVVLIQITTLTVRKIQKKDQEEGRSRTSTEIERDIFRKSFETTTNLERAYVVANFGAFGLFCGFFLRVLFQG